MAENVDERDDRRRSSWLRAGEASTAIAPITTVIGTIVGAYFGMQKGAEGTEAAEEGRRVAEERASRAEDKATRLAGAVPDAGMVAWALGEAELPVPRGGPRAR
jgi:hypothetical protein